MTNRAYAYELSSLFKHTQQADVYSAQASSSSCCVSVDSHHRRTMACDPSSVPVLAIFRGCVHPFHIETENRPYQIDAFLRLDIRFPSERIEEEKMTSAHRFDCQFTAWSIRHDVWLQTRRRYENRISALISAEINFQWRYFRQMCCAV